MQQQRVEQRYLLLVSLFLLIGACVLLPYYLVLIAAGEHLRVDEVVDRQLAQDALYLPALRPPEFQYKRSLAEQVDPEIAIIGTSTTLSFQQHHFTRRAVNMGRVLRTVDDLEVLLRDWTPPKAVILSADLWWFNPQSWRGNSDYADVGGWPPPGAALTIIDWLGLDQMRDILLDPPVDRIGLRSIMTGDGFSPFGNYVLDSLVSGRKRAKDRKFQHTLRRIDAGETRFEPAGHADAESVTKFTALVDRMRQNGVRVFTYTSPLAPTVRAYMREQGGYGLIRNLSSMLADWDARHLDLLTNAESFTGDCEYMDASHPGEIASMRILLALAERQPVLLNYIDANDLARRIEEFGGHVVEPHPETRYTAETDHLELGCERSSAFLVDH